MPFCELAVRLHDTCRRLTDDDEIHDDRLLSALVRKESKPIDGLYIAARI
jgi:hypothetical protein